MEKISQTNIIETVDGSSYTQAALSKMIVVDHMQAPKAEKADKQVLMAESLNAASAIEKKAITKYYFFKI